MASIIGATAAQECIKLMTSQYVPVSNLLVYNGLKCETVNIKV